MRVRVCVCARQAELYEKGGISRVGSVGHVGLLDRLIPLAQLGQLTP